MNKSLKAVGALSVLMLVILTVYSCGKSSSGTDSTTGQHRRYVHNTPGQYRRDGHDDGPRCGHDEG